MNYDKIKLPLTLGILGFIFSTTRWIMFIHGLDPLVGIVLYYVLLFVIILIMEHFGLVVAGIKFDSISRTIGTLFIVFAFFITVSSQGCYIRTILGKECDRTHGMYLHSEDGFIYWLWAKQFTDVETLRILTYVITPVIMAFIGMLLIDDNDQIVLSPVKFKKG